MRENIFKTEKIMAHEEGPQAPPTAQGAQGPLAPKNPPPPQNPHIPLVPNVPQVLQAPEATQLLTKCAIIRLVPFQTQIFQKTRQRHRSSFT